MCAFSPTFSQTRKKKNQGYTKRRTENATCQSQGLHRPCRSCRSKHLCRSPSPSPIREGGLHVLIVSFHERFRFPFSTFRRSLAGAPEGSRVQRSPGPKLQLTACTFPPIFPESPGLVCLPYKPLERLEQWRASRVKRTTRFLQIQFKKSKSTVADDRERKNLLQGGCTIDQK